MSAQDACLHFQAVFPRVGEATKGAAHTICQFSYPEVPRRLESKEVGDVIVRGIQRDEMRHEADAGQLCKLESGRRALSGERGPPPPILPQFTPEGHWGESTRLVSTGSRSGYRN